MTRIPVTKDGLALLRKQAKAAVKAGNSPLSQYSGLVFVLDGKEIPFTDVLVDEYKRFHNDMPPGKNKRGKFINKMLSGHRVG